jgi:hypothetical protein
MTLASRVRGWVVRKWIILLVFSTVVCGLTASAQPPASRSSDRPIVITPRKSGDLERDFPGFIIIRPKGSVSFTPTPAAPKATANPSITTQPAPATKPAPKKDVKEVFDYWFAAAVEGNQIGYLHWDAREIEKDGKKLYVGRKYQKFTVARFGQLVTQFGEESTVETPDGEVAVTSMRQGIGKDQALALTGIVEGKTLKVTGEGAGNGASASIPWPGGVTGVVREPQLFKEKAGLKPGDTFEYLSYVPQVNWVAKVVVTFEGEDTATLWKGTPPRKYRRYVSRMEPIKAGDGGTFKLPPATTWIDVETDEPMRVEFKFPVLGGRVTFLRTTKEAATEPVGKVPDLFNVQSIRLDREIPGIHTRTAVVYKVTAPDEDEPGTLFPGDGRQEVKNLDAKARTFELHVGASHGPAKDAKPDPEPGKEYLGSNFFINWDNADVRMAAAKAVAGLPPAATDWTKAKAVERWVHQNMRAVEFSQAMATADNVAKTLSGDCTEYAMLAAAMCRAAGVPSRTVLGLVYAPGPGGRPFLAYHMWFEVYADGQWLPLDGTLGQGGVGPGHIKISAHSWHEEKTIAPLLPVLRVLMARPGFKVLKVTPEN